MTQELEKQIAEDWQQRGYNFFSWLDVPGKNWPPIQHPYDEVVILLKGSLTFVVDGKRVDLEPNKEIFVPAGAPHSVHNPGKTHNHWCYGYRILENEGKAAQ